MTARRGQGELEFRTWGGHRAGAGRKPLGPRRGVAHRPRPVHCGRHPVHVTMRAVPGLLSLRSRHVFPAVSRALARASRARFRVVEFSVQSNHIHLLVEAEATKTLTRGMQGLGIRIAKAVNRCLARRGRVWNDRYHSRTLRTPREVRNALVYVLQNGRKHGMIGGGVDGCSSGPWFAGWRNRIRAPYSARPVARATTWLLSAGWKRAGLIDVNEIPSTPKRETG